jgi:hypothetical protein
MLRFIAICAVAVSAALTQTTSVLAHETGLSGMHTQVTMGNRICMTEHTHDGKGDGPSEREARMSAAQAWSSFTEWEYGPAWSSYALSNAKRENCQNTGSGYTCYFVSYPCKARGGRVAAAPVAKPRNAAAPRATQQRKAKPTSRSKTYRLASAPKAKTSLGPRTAKVTAKTSKKRAQKPTPALRSSSWTDAVLSSTIAMR